MDNVSKNNNKQLVLKCFELLIKNDAIDNEDITNLLNEEYCKLKFSRTKFPVLIEIDNENEIDKYAKDNNEWQRYYKQIININGRKFLVSNFWYGSNGSQVDSKAPFYEWVISKL
ncbi:MAG: hypothetical protein PUI80_02135 [Peptoniphilaceae bacterium]|nr:hypothetical protein [Peptoniphilaceae bacterium]